MHAQAMRAREIELRTGVQRTWPACFVTCPACTGGDPECHLCLGTAKVTRPTRDEHLKTVDARATVAA